MKGRRYGNYIVTGEVAGLSIAFTKEAVNMARFDLLNEMRRQKREEHKAALAGRVHIHTERTETPSGIIQEIEIYARPGEYHWRPAATPRAQEEE